ncbi:YfhO family protein, partial [Mycobacterium tuberculosis]|nr:YfhO family protein [Mycobacterium tuberculosis]
GMHAPNMFLHRYSWIFSLTIILMAGEVLNRIEAVSLQKKVGILTYLQKISLEVLTLLNMDQFQ